MSYHDVSYIPRGQAVSLSVFPAMPAVLWGSKYHICHFVYIICVMYCSYSILKEIKSYFSAKTVRHLHFAATSGRSLRPWNWVCLLCLRWWENEKSFIVGFIKSLRNNLVYLSFLFFFSSSTTTSAWCSYRHGITILLKYEVLANI